jgi:leucyl-tRNA synthetase
MGMVEGGDLETGTTPIYAGFCRPFAEDELGLIRRFLIADVQARFLRSQGRSVLFAPAVEAFGEAVELAAAQNGLTPGAAVDEYVGRLQRQLQSLDISCDWQQSVLSSEPDHCLRVQRVFLELMEEGLIYKREHGADSSRWAVRTSHFAERCDFGSTPPAGWSAEAVEMQEAALSRADGVEIRAVIPGTGDLVVFTPHADSVAQAAFVSVSPNHPQIETIATPAELAKLRDARGKTAFVQTSLRVAVPAVDELLPLVLTPDVDTRFGPTAVLGIPDRDETDRKIAAGLKSLPGLSLGTVRVRSEPKPAARFSLPDLTISRKGSWGAPVPIVDCQQCGTVPIPSAELPLSPPEPAGELDCECPRCNGSAKLDGANIDEGFASMWMWPSICAKGDGVQTAQAKVIWSKDGADLLLLQRVAAHLLDKLNQRDSVAEGEPFPTVLMHGSLADDDEETAIDGVSGLEAYVADAGSDVARLAILNAGSPARSTHLYEHLLRHAERFVERVRGQLETYGGRPVPERIDPSTRSRRRLAAWSKIAADKVALHLEHLELHKATYDVMQFHNRIQAFEASCIESGGPSEADRDAIAWALVRLGRMSKPLMPQLGAELAGEWS